MTSQNQNEKDAKTPTAHQDDAAQKAAHPSQVMRELTDDEIAAVAGGGIVVKTGTPRQGGD